MPVPHVETNTIRFIKHLKSMQSWLHLQLLPIFPKLDRVYWTSMKWALRFGGSKGFREQTEGSWWAICLSTMTGHHLIENQFITLGTEASFCQAQFYIIDLNAKRVSSLKYLF